MIPKRLGKSIKWDAAREMVYMMNANVGGHPLKKLGQNVVRTALKGGLV